MFLRRIVKKLHKSIFLKCSHRGKIAKIYSKLDRMYLCYLMGKYLRPTIFEFSEVISKPTYIGKTKINRVAVYIPSQDIVCSLNAPAHHHNVLIWLMNKGLWKYKEFYKDPKNKGKKYCLYGFMTDEGRFVQRRQAARIARAAKQVDKDNTYLFSEDMWSLSEDPRFEGYFFRYK